MIFISCGFIIVATVTDDSIVTSGYELEVFHDRAMTCSTLIIPVLYSIPVITTALGNTS